MDMEPTQFGTGFAVVEAAIGLYAVDVERQKPDAGETVKKRRSVERRSVGRRSVG